MAKLTHSALTMKPATFAAEAHKIGGRKNVGCESLTQVSQEMAKLQERLDGVAASMSGFIFTFRKDADGHTRFPFASAGVEGIFGVSSEDIYDDAAVLRERFHPDDLLQLDEHLKESQRRLTRLCFEIRVNHPTQGQRWVEIRCSPRSLPDCAIEWHGLMTDITERKQLENRQREQINFQSTLLNALNDVGMQLLVIENGRIIHVGNRELARRDLGYTDEELDAHPLLSEFIHPDDRDLVISNYHRRLAGESIISSYEIGLVSRKGERREHDAAIAIVPGTSPQRIITVGRDISARKQVEKKLRAAEEKFRALVENSPDIVVRYDRLCRRTYVNPAYERTHGLSAQQVLGKTPTDFFSSMTISGRTAAFIEQSVSEVIASGHSTKIDIGWKDPEGRPVYLEMLLVPEFAADGSVVSVLTLTRDITEQRAAARQLAFKGFAWDNAGEAVYLMTKDGRFVEVNEEACQMLGYDRQELLAGGVSVIDPDFRPIGFDGRHLPSEQVGISRTLETRHRTKDGRLLDVEVIARDIEYEGIVYTMAFVRDVTERKRLSEQLTQMFRAVEQSPVSIIITDREGNIQYTNPKFTEVTGYSEEEVVGKQPQLLKGGGLDPEHYRELWTALASGQEWRGEFHNRKKSGERFWESALITPIVDKDGVITQYLSITEDITARRELEEQLRQTQKMEAIGQLATCVAHDFNNLLSVIILQTELVSTDKGLAQEVQEAMMEVRSSAERAARLTGQLLLFGRKKVMQPRALDLNDVIANFTKMLSRLLREDTHLKLLLHSHPLTIHADVGMLEQVLMNLAVNAADAMPNGGQLLIETSEKIVDDEASTNTPDLKPGRYVGLSVSDTGTGIPPEVMPRIFDPFFTTKVVGKGTGLGLATVYGIVKQHGGSISVSSQVGEGTRFHILLPACEGAMIQRPVASTESSLPGGSECILVVEDQPAVRASLCRMLRRCGYHVLEAENGVQACHLWKAHQYEVVLVLIDLIMPGGMSGHQLAQCLRADKPQLKILFTSGYGTDIANREGDQIDGAEFVAKPFQSQLLLETIRRILDR